MQSELAQSISGDVVTVRCDVGNPAADAVVDPTRGSGEGRYVGKGVDVGRVGDEAAVVWEARVVVGEVACDGGLLVRGNAIDVGEAAAGRVVGMVRKASGIVDGGFRLGVEDTVAWVDFCGTDVCDVGTIVGPGWVEDVVVRP